MKRTLRMLTLAAATLVCPAFAQTDAHCYKYDEYTRVCEFSNGRVHVQTTIGDESWSDWYTAAQWKAKKAKDTRAAARAAAAKAKEHEAWQRQNDNGEKEAQSWKTQDGCENDGFIWVVKGELINGVVDYKGSCHYSEAAKRIHKEKQQGAK